MSILTTHERLSERRQFSNQSEFNSFAAENTLQDRKPVLAIANQLCSGGDSGYASGCTLASTYIYTLSKDYRTEGKIIFSYLKSNGFDFRAKNKYIEKTAVKLDDTKIANNMSNTEPIIVDLYHDTRDARVRVNLGDRKRTLPYATSPELDLVDNNQLIVGLQFYSP